MRGVTWLADSWESLSCYNAPGGYMTALPLGEFGQSSPVVLHFGPILRKLDDREFFEFCQLNRDLRIERTAEGDLLVMPPTGGETGHRNFVLYVLFAAWAEKDGSGIAFDSSTGFVLPNGALRSPDLAWLTRDRWNGLSKAERDGFIPLCPDFVVELRSRSDSILRLRAKMLEYTGNGARLGWLIDPDDRKVYVYDASGETCLDDPQALDAGLVLPGFVLRFDPFLES